MSGVNMNFMGTGSTYGYGAYTGNTYMSGMKTGATSAEAYYGSVQAGGTQTDGVSEGQDVSSARLRAMKRSGQVECETCASRKYKDGSDEADVSYKSASHIDPSASAGKVMAHEQEHVANAHEKAATGGGKVISASVTLKTAVCPECGRSYVAGGVTNTAISYPKNAYGQNQKSADYSAVAGQNVDYAV